MARVSLTDLLVGFKSALKSAHEDLTARHLQFLEGYFEDKGDGVLRPKSVKLAVPSRDPARPGESDILDVPLFSLIPKNTLYLKHVEIEFEVHLHLEQAKDAPKVNPKGPIHVTDPESGAAMSVELKGSMFKAPSTVAKVKLVFDAGEPPEAVSRIDDHYSKSVG